MKLVSLETIGFKKLRNHRFDFTDGLNVIVGDNAQGKSTLLQALECALYGVSVVPGKKEHVITWGQKTWKVVLHFMVNDVEYLLTRSKSTAKLERGGEEYELIANGNTPVTEAVTELLGLSAKDYNLFMQSKQGETSGALTFGAAALNRKVEEFSGISTIDDVLNLAQEDHRNAKAQVNALASNPEDIEESKTELKAAQDKFDKCQDLVQGAQEALDSAPKVEDIVAPESDPDAMLEQRERLSTLRDSLSRAELAQQNAQDNLKSAEARLAEAVEPADVSDLEENLATLKRQVKDAVSKANALSDELSDQQSLWGRLESAEESYEKCRDADTIGDELSQVVGDKVEAEAALEHAKESKIKLDGSISSIEALQKDAKCPTCGTQLSEHDPEKLAEELKELEAKRDQAKKDVRNAKNKLDQLEVESGKLQRELETCQRLEADVDKLREQLVEKGVDLATGETPTEAALETAKAEHEKVLSKKTSLEHQIEQNEEVSRRYDSAKRDVTKGEEKLADAKQSVEQLKGRLDKCLEAGEPTKEDIAESKSLWDQYHQLVNDQKVNLTERRNQLEVAELNLKEAKRDVDRWQHSLDTVLKRAEESKEAEQLMDKASRLAKFLRERRAGYLQEVWDAVLAVTTKQVATATHGMVSRVVFDDGDFYFEEDGILSPIASASGAQKAHIGVALRVGLSRALYGKNALLIFDEPTESMREHLAIGLAASLASAATQCLLITHREQDQDLAANVLEVAA